MKTAIRNTTQSFFSKFQKEEIIGKINPTKISNMSSQLIQNLSFTDIDNCIGRPVFYWLQDQFPLVKSTRFGME